MSILSVANVHFESTGANRIEYRAANDQLNIITTGNISITSRNFALSNNPGAVGNVLTSNGTTWISQEPAIAVQPGTSGNVLTSNGTTWISSPPIALQNDENTNSSFYVTFTTANTGKISTVTVSSSKLYYTPNTGTLSATTFNSLSDITLKDNIKNIENALEKLEKMRGVTFTWKNNGIPSMGLIAQEVELGAPELVTEHDGIKNINYDGLTGLLVETIKELKARIEKLENNK